MPRAVAGLPLSAGAALQAASAAVGRRAASLARRAGGPRLALLDAAGARTGFPRGANAADDGAPASVGRRAALVSHARLLLTQGHARADSRRSARAVARPRRRTRPAADRAPASIGRDAAVVVPASLRLRHRRTRVCARLSACVPAGVCVPARVGARVRRLAVDIDVHNNRRPMPGRHDPAHAGELDSQLIVLVVVGADFTKRARDARAGPRPVDRLGRQPQRVPIAQGNPGDLTVDFVWLCAVERATDAEVRALQRVVEKPEKLAVLEDLPLIGRQSEVDGTRLPRGLHGRRVARTADRASNDNHETRSKAPDEHGFHGRTTSSTRVEIHPPGASERSTGPRAAIKSRASPRIAVESGRFCGNAEMVGRVALRGRGQRSPNLGIHSDFRRMRVTTRDQPTAPEPRPESPAHHRRQISRYAPSRLRAKRGASMSGEAFIRERRPPRSSASRSRSWLNPTAIRT
jgi:hypothetical protein